LVLCEPGGEFYVRPDTGSHSATVTATVPARADGFGGRVITGVARDDVNSRLTPVALALPAPLVVNFHLQWTAFAGERFEESEPCRPSAAERHIGALAGWNTPVLSASSSARITCTTALISARWVNACGKLPRCRPVRGSISSA
jgi:hypothetical protein